LRHLLRVMAMVAPMEREHQRNHGQAGGDHAVGGLGRQPVFRDQRGEAGDHQQHGETAEAVAAVMMVVSVVHVVVMAMMAAVSAMPAAAVFMPFVERKFVAHTDIKFAHKSPLVLRGLDGPTRRISSHNHQKSIILIK
jgi:hypothetical protein